MSTNSAISRQPLESTLRALEKGGNTERMDAFLDELLRLAADRGTITCTAAGGDALRVQTGDEIVCQWPVLRARTKLRTLCARLSVRCREWSGKEVSPYGDEVEFDYPITMQRCKVRFVNTPGSQQITVEGNLASRLGELKMDKSASTDVAHLQSDFFEQLHSECYHRLNNASAHIAERQPVPVRGVAEMFSAHEVWTLVFSVIRFVAPSVLATVFLMFWNDLMGKRTVEAADVTEELEQIKELLEELQSNINSEYKRQKDIPMDKAIAELKKMGWDEDKTEKGLKMVLATMAEKLGKESQ